MGQELVVCSELQRLALEELARRKLVLKDIDVLSCAFPEQRNFILDPHRLKALWCTRRAAKSFTGGLYLIKEALEYPGCNVLFLGLTRLSAKGIIWKDILKIIDQEFGLNLRFNESELTATLPNGSVIYINGCDASEEEMNKLLGRKYRLVVLDEASMFSIDVRQLIYGVLKLATADYLGTICMLGTSSNVLQGLFFDITRTDGVEREAGWSLHEWTFLENPHVADQVAQEIAEIEADRPLFMETPIFRQWYLNEWVIDEDALVYKFKETRNLAKELPPELSGWHYVLGVDLAHSPDSTAFVVGAYHEADPVLYFVYAYKQLGMDFTAVAEKTRELTARYHFDVKIVDGANKMGVEEMNSRHGTGFIPADKTGKFDFIMLMNSELIQERIKCLPQALPLVEEWKKLVWVTENGKILEPKKEHPGIHNDLSDSALYLWRHCYQWLWTEKEKPAAPGTLESWEPKHIEKLRDQVRREQNPNELQLDWDEAWGDFSGQ